MVTANCSNFANYRGQIWSELLEGNSAWGVGGM